MPSYDIYHLPALNWMIVFYFLFGGLAGGGFLLSFWAGYGKENSGHLARASAQITPIALIIGLLLLVFHLGHPFRFWLTLTTFRPSSVISWGTWVLTLFMIVSTVYAFLWRINKGGSAKVLGWLGVPLALFTSIYTGLLLMQLSGSPLWDSALLPWIFLVGGLVSAAAVSVLVLTLTGHEPAEPFFGLKRYICALVILELVMVGSELVALYTGSAESARVANMLLIGRFSVWFVGLQIIVGSVLPLGLLILAGAFRSRILPVLVSVLLLIGVLTVRFVVVFAGRISL